LRRKGRRRQRRATALRERRCRALSGQGAGRGVAAFPARGRDGGRPAGDRSL